MIATLGKNEDGANWRCPGCGSLMGKLFRHKVHLRPHGGPTYFSRYPITGVCNNCARTNTIKRPPSR